MTEEKAIPHSKDDQHLVETTVSSEIMAQGKMLTVRYDEACPMA